MTDVREQAEKIHTARVSITRAWVYDSLNPDHEEDNPETWGILDAEDFDPQKHDHLECYCADCFVDKGALVGLHHPRAEKEQTYPAHKINPQTGKKELDEENQPIIVGRHYVIPTHYWTKEGHYHQCDFSNRLARVSQLEKDLREAKDEDQEKITIKMGIPTKPPQPRSLADDHKRSLRKNFDKSGKRAVYPSDKPVELKSASEMAKILDATGRNKSKRQLIELEIGSDKTPLSDLYFERGDEMRKAFEPDKERIALFCFRPSGNQKDWKNLKYRPCSVTSKTDKIEDRSGLKQNITMHLEFQTYSAFKAFEAACNEAPNPKKAELLIFSDNVKVSTTEPTDETKSAARLSHKFEKPHTDVHIYASISNARQFALWGPPSPQMPLFDKNFGTPEREDPSEQLTLL